ncbi:MAG: FAD-dependent oxidoreductase [Terriglobales bacterium]
MGDRILVIGGVAAGLSAASRARRLDPEARITVLERGPAAGYSACGLPYMLAGRVSLASLLTHPPEFFCERRGLDLRLGQEALEIEPARHRVRVRAEGSERWEHYDRLVVATGARARWQPSKLRNVFTANTWAEAAAFDAALRGGDLRRVAVVGGGYIGVEMAEALVLRGGLEVHLVHRHGALLGNFDPDFVAPLAGDLQRLGVHLHLGTHVAALDGPPDGRVLALETSAGALATDAVLNCAGLAPQSALAAAAGIALGRTGAIAVDEQQQTNLAGVGAAGDCAESRHRLTGGAVWTPLGAVANQQGRVAGAHAAGRPAPNGRRARYPGVLGTLALALAGTGWGRTGLTLAQARAAGLAPAWEDVEAGDRASYLGPVPLRTRLIYQPATGRLLGCQMSGAPAALAGRLDVAATALAAGFTLEQLETLDLAYQPALAPLYEPLQIAAHNALGR